MSDTFFNTLCLSHSARGIQIPLFLHSAHYSLLQKCWSCLKEVRSARIVRTESVTIRNAFIGTVSILVQVSRQINFWFVLKVLSRCMQRIALITNLLGNYLKRQCHEIFYLRFSTWISFPKPLIICIIRAISNFFKNSWRYSELQGTTDVVDTGGKWKKSSIRKIFIISFGHLLGSRVSMKINFFLQVLFKLSAVW